MLQQVSIVYILYVFFFCAREGSAVKPLFSRYIWLYLLPMRGSRPHVDKGLYVSNKTREIERERMEGRLIV